MSRYGSLINISLSSTELAGSSIFLFICYRSPQGLCVGVDPNRNWGMCFDHGGAADGGCSDIYHGPYAFSERCTANIRDFLLRTPNIVFFDDLHSYSQLVLLPYGVDGTGNCSRHPTDELERFNMATKVSTVNSPYSEYSI